MYINSDYQFKKKKDIHTHKGSNQGRSRASKLEVMMMAIMMAAFMVTVAMNKCQEVNVSLKEQKNHLNEGLKINKCS